MPTMPHPATRERRLLCDLLDALGPDQPTMCKGWTTYDLAVHLMVRDRRPDAVPGLLVGGPFAAWTQRLERQARQTTSYADAVAAVRRGPPALSAVGMPAANVHEFFVHHEDVRRLNGGEEPRELEPDLIDALWKRLALLGLVFFRRSPVGVDLAAPGRPVHTAKRGSPVVTVEGPVGELFLLAYNRTQAAKVEVKGSPDAVARFRSARLGP